MKRKPICGAKTRLGLPCQRKLLLRGRKCPNHGGRSTGALTPETKAKAIAAMHSVRHSPGGRAAHSATMRALWASPEFRLKVAMAKAIRGARKDFAFVREARFNLAELDRRVAWAAVRRAKRVAKIQALEAEVLRAQIATELGFKPG